MSVVIIFRWPKLIPYFLIYLPRCGLFFSVSDLLDYINPDAELKAREIQKKQARAKVFFLLASLLTTMLVFPSEVFVYFLCHRSKTRSIKTSGKLWKMKITGTQPQSKIVHG